MEEPVRAFISYSWSSPEHEEWVLRLATNLRASGIDAILDKWDLREGDEANAFMERMVTDQNISKVIIVSDGIYAEKSNKRLGGAGTEAQIISQKIFDSQEKGKFVVIVKELDENGGPFLPAYYTSRVYIDFSQEDKFSEKFEQLLRWLVGRPGLVKPALGSLPKYIIEPENSIMLSTAILQRRAIDCISNNRRSSYPALNEYLEHFLAEIEKFRLPDQMDPLSEDFMDNLKNFLPYRDEFVEIVRIISRYGDGEKYGESISEFFEKMSSYLYGPMGKSYRDSDFDNFRFFLQEMFLLATYVFIEEKRYDYLNILLKHPYYITAEEERGREAMRHFDFFRQNIRVLRYRNQKLGLNRLSLHADLIKERCNISNIKFTKIMQADFVLFIRALLMGGYWWPETSIYLDYPNPGLELFQRARSASFFEKIRPIFNGATKQDLESICSQYENDGPTSRAWMPGEFNPRKLLALDRICSMP